MPTQDRDEREEREYRAAMRRLKLLERRVKLGMASLFVAGPFCYVLVATIAAGFGAHPAALPWRLLIPFMACGLAIVFNLDLRDVLVLFGNLGAALAQSAPRGRGRDDDDDDGAGEEDAP